MGGGGWGGGGCGRRGGGGGGLGWSGAVEDDCGRGAWESTIAEAAAAMVSTPMAVPVDLARLESLQRLVRKRSRGSEDEGGEVSFDAWGRRHFSRPSMSGHHLAFIAHSSEKDSTKHS